MFEKWRAKRKLEHRASLVKEQDTCERLLRKADFLYLRLLSAYIKASKRNDEKYKASAREALHDLRNIKSGYRETLEEIELELKTFST